MSEPPVRPTVDRGEWIRIGPETAVLRRLALVCSRDEERPRVVYLDDGDNAICERVAWEGDHWALIRPEMTATDADEDRLLAPFVQLLRARLGRPGKKPRGSAKKDKKVKAKKKVVAKRPVTKAKPEPKKKPAAKRSVAKAKKKPVVEGKPAPRKKERR